MSSGKDIQRVAYLQLYDEHPTDLGWILVYLQTLTALTAAVFAVSR